MSSPSLFTPDLPPITQDPTPNTRTGGPRTPEGKARSSKNALKHGLTARDVVVTPEERPEFEELLASYTAELSPCGVLEETLFNEIVHAAWNLRRLHRLEASLATSQPDPLLDDDLEDKITRLHRYHARAERTFHRSLKELRALQTERAARDILADRQAEAPVLAPAADLAKRTQICLRPGPRMASIDLHRPWRDAAPPAADLPFDPPPAQFRLPDLAEARCQV
jgi:hypothetical protein